MLAQLPDQVGGVVASDVPVPCRAPVTGDDDYGARTLFAAGDRRTVTALLLS